MALADVTELLRARELTANLVRRDLKVRHRGTFLGMLWSLTTPLLFVGLYYFIFTLHPQGGAACTTWPAPTARSSPSPCTSSAASSSGTSSPAPSGPPPGASSAPGYLLNKVYFPRAILPLATVLSALVTFGFELAVLILAGLVFAGVPSFHLLWLPLIVAVAAVLAFGLALALSAVTVFLRDVAHFIGVFLQLWFWGTPIIYSLNYLGGPARPRAGCSSSTP